MATKTTATATATLEQLSTGLKLAESKKNELSKAFQDLRYHTSSILSLTVQCESYFDAIEASLKNRIEELEFKEEEVAVKELLVGVRIKELEAREREVAVKERSVGVRIKELEAREREVAVKERSVGVRIKELEARECEFAVRLSDLENSECRVKSLEDSNLKVENEQGDCDYSVSMDGKVLQFFLNERVDVHEKIGDQVFAVLKISSDPAKLVLDAMEGFYPLQRLKNGGKEFELGVVRRSCVLLLEQLLRASPPIRTNVREDAKRVASEWKGKMGVEELEVLGVLLLVGVYGLVPEFDKKEIAKLFGVVEKHRLASELRRVLGITDSVDDFNPGSSKGKRKKMTTAGSLDMMHWTPPSDGFVKVNFDGAFIKQDKLGGLGVVVRDKNGKVIAARARKLLGMVKNQVVELWAAREALDFISSLGYNKIVVEGDCMNVIRLLLRKKKLNNDEKAVALDAFRLESKFTLCSFVHVRRTGNEVAHAVSKFATTIDSVKEWKEDIPSWLSMLSELDIQGSSIIPPAVKIGQSLQENSQGNSTVASRSESPWPELKSLCINMDGNGLGLFLSEHMKEHDEMQSEVFDALLCASDPVKLVLDAIQGNNLNPDRVESFKLGVSRTSCILLLEQLWRLSPQIEPPIKEEAMKVAVEWKGECSEENENHVKVLGFLQLVATFGLISSFDRADLLCLLKTVYQHERTPDLFRILGLSNSIRKFIRFLINEKHRLQAIRYIFAFNKVGKFSPIQLLKDHVYDSMTRAKKLCKEGRLAQGEATNEEIGDLRAIIKCIADYKLDSEYSPDILEKRLALLEKQNEDGKDTEPAPASTTAISTGDSPNVPVRTSSAVYTMQPSTSATIHSRENNTSSTVHLQPPHQPASLFTNQGAYYPSCDGKALQLFLNERIDVHEMIGDEVLVAIKISLDPGKLVLDAMEGFYPLQGPKNGGKEFELGVVRRSCVLLLEQLLRASPLIRPNVRDDAKKVASEWKGKMGVEELEVLGVLLLVGVYGLVPEFDKDEIVKLFGVVEKHRLTSELRRVLGITDNVAAVNPGSSKGKQEKMATAPKISRISLPRIPWTPPFDDYVKVNFDGSFISQDQLGGLGVVVRNKNGKVIAARARKILGMLKAHVVELWAAREALDLVSSLGFNKIIVEGDCLGVINLLLRKTKPKKDENAIVLDAFRLASGFTSCLFTHVKRRGNEVADGLSKFATKVDSVEEWKEDVPSWLSILSELDIQGIAENRATAQFGFAGNVNDQHYQSPGTQTSMDQNTCFNLSVPYYLQNAAAAPGYYDTATSGSWLGLPPQYHPFYHSYNPPLF